MAYMTDAERAAAPSKSDLAEEQAWLDFNHTRPERELLYAAWCSHVGLDPEDTATAVAYEQHCADQAATEEMFTYWRTQGYAS